MGAVSLLQKWQLAQAIVADPAVSGTAKLVAVRLLHHLNSQTGRCSPSYQTVADGTGLKRRAVIYAVQELETGGWLVVERVKGGDPQAAQGFVTNAFALNFDRAGDDPPVHDDALPPGAAGNTPPGASQCTPPGALPCTPGVHHRAPPGVHGGAPKQGKLTGKGDREESPPTPRRFDEWWEAYPRKVGKDAAHRAFLRIVGARKATIDEMIAGARRYAAEREGEPQTFTKHPTTWLNGGCWADEPAPPRPGPAQGRQGFSAMAYLADRMHDDG